MNDDDATAVLVENCGNIQRIGKRQPFPLSLFFVDFKNEALLLSRVSKGQS